MVLSFYCGFYFSRGLHLKKLDKKLERTLLHSYRKVGLLSKHNISLISNLQAYFIYLIYICQVGAR
ncbi:hypothetical protein Pint_07425 [Pistacia integerrima]|uniref:Uncharacterized protein n=1 Tax=Pistacia integerrima TaxID=434235 RepID=A0ACC0XU91_9ROSI|nr:hypothetical protein Pint_07425 [Pistacia integerrima]